jgi:hypothetical protein
MYSGFVVVGRVFGTVRVVGRVVGLVVVRTVVVGNEHVGLLAPFVQQYFPFPLLAQPLNWNSIKLLKKCSPL